jgi:hypothetical protein
MSDLYRAEPHFSAIVYSTISNTRSPLLFLLFAFSERLFGCNEHLSSFMASRAAREGETRREREKGEREEGERANSDGDDGDVASITPL